MRILLGAHTINPTRGGEAGIGWGWAEAFARSSAVERVDVIAHPVGRGAVEERLRRHPELRAKLEFHWVLPPESVDPWKGPVTGKIVWHRWLLHYQLWHRYAERCARELVRHVDVAQHVTPGNIFLRSFVTGLPVPYIIGPVGGGQAPLVTDSLRLLARNPGVHGGIEVARSTVVRGAARRRILRRRLGRAVTVLCANSQTLAIARRYQPRSELMIDGGITQLPSSPATLNGGAPIVLWVGKMEARKDPLAAIDVASELANILPQARTILIGDGWLYDRVAQEIRDRRLHHIVGLRGALLHSEMSAAYTAASVFLFTSHRDTFGVQNLEAMAHGLPVVFRSSPGVAVDDFAGGSAIPVAAEGFAVGAARCIARLVGDPAVWMDLHERARIAAAAAFWSSKASRVLDSFSRWS